MAQDHWMQVTNASTQIEAEMMRNLLTGEGIACLVQTSDAVAYLGVMSPCKLMVREADMERASEFLHAWVEAVPESDEMDYVDQDYEG